jgi:hypothetical protein
MVKGYGHVGSGLWDSIARRFELAARYVVRDATGLTSFSDLRVRLRSARFVMR